MVGQTARHCSRSSASREVIISTLEPNAMASSANISRTRLKSTAATSRAQFSNHAAIERRSSSNTGKRFIPCPDDFFKLSVRSAAMLRSAAMQKIDRQIAFTGTKEVAEPLRIDPARLEAHLAQNV